MHGVSKIAKTMPSQRVYKKEDKIEVERIEVEWETRSEEKRGWCRLCIVLQGHSASDTPLQRSLIAADLHVNIHTSTLARAAEHRIIET